MPDHPICPRCHQAGIEGWTLFTRLEVTCNRCGWLVTAPADTDATRLIWRRLIARGIRRLRTVYGVHVRPETAVAWHQETVPMWGWDLAADRLRQAAIQRVPVPMLVDETEWQAAIQDAEAAEWAELRLWLWTAFAPLVSPAEQAA